ncbi:triose-phosphate transporter family-domain-containing protein [Neurospora hispaniola]|uniref:Triose-phosphate transporter family-domain-containing protein n=1 Tax=Neurospora hispaniola TaxID=588809 RepID=A0AAJ0MW55_9PEZI|nr:triose-phosphate transporter family-domain-containing protein [Neurospora hispaniola]
MAADDVETQAEKAQPVTRSIHPVFYIASWIFFSNITILFNKWLLAPDRFSYPTILTCWHLIFATIATQILARTTTLLDGRKSVKMTGRLYLRAIVPIGFLFSGSLVCSNMVYLYLSVAFIQMLKAAAPVAVLLTAWVWGVEQPSQSRLINVLFIVFGVGLASFGEIAFSLTGFLFQLGGIVFEAMRLIMIQVLLKGDGQKMDPLVSLYYFAPVCASMNFVVALFTEFRSFNIADLYNTGLWCLLLNAVVAFMLNISSVCLIGRTSGLVMTLTGILKNILLVVASVMIWQTSITPLQFLGYAIALAGLVYYSLGRDQIVEIATQLWTFLRGVWENSPAYSSVSSSSSDEGNGQQQGGGLPSAVRRALLMGLGVMVVVILAAGYIYSGADPSGGGGAVGVPRPLGGGGGGDASSVKPVQVAS